MEKIYILSKPTPEIESLYRARGVRINTRMERLIEMDLKVTITSKLDSERCKIAFVQVGSEETATRIKELDSNWT